MTSPSLLTSVPRDPSDQGPTIPPPVWMGLTLFVLTFPVHLLLNNDASVRLAAITLVLIGCAYIGFGAADGQPRVFWSELAVALFFCAAAVLGLLWHWSALPLALALHAVWDVMHHNGYVLVRIPRLYIPFRVIYDLMLATSLMLLFLM